MANIGDIFQSKYLSANDVPDGGMKATIAFVDVQKFKKQDGGEEVKPVIEFEGIEKAFVCNKTNAMTIAERFGNETDDWVGKELQLDVTWVDFQGKQVESIRVRKERKRAAAVAPGRPARQPAPAAPAPAAVNEDADADVPF